MNRPEHPDSPESVESPEEPGATPPLEADSDAEPVADGGVEADAELDAETETAPEETAPEETAAEETTPERTAPEETAAEETGPEETAPEEELTSLYVRRGRTPTLGFWVALAIALPALAALLSAPLFDFADISGVLNFMLVAAVFVGLPLAAIAAGVDAFRHRGEGRKKR